MSMSKQDFVALADAIKAYNEQAFPGGTNTASPLQSALFEVLIARLGGMQRLIRKLMME